MWSRIGELSEKLDWPEGTEILVMEGMEEGQENVRLPEVSPEGQRLYHS